MRESGGASAAIVSIGNELLFGETVDTNAAWLGRHLSSRGIEVVRGYTVGDVAEDIDEAVGLAMAAADLVVLTGGLGPTPDDLTKAVVAHRFGRELVVDADVRTRLEGHFRAAGYGDVPERSRGQAEIPAGAVALSNPSGTAPGILMDVDGVRIVLLPGVPRELMDIVEGSLASHLDDLAGERTHHRVVHTTGLAETTLAERLESALDAVPGRLKEGIDLAYLPDLRGVDLRFTIRGGSAGEAETRFGALLRGLDDVLRPWRFEADDGDIAVAVSRQLRRRGWRLAVAESCTGGLVAARVTDVPGASEVFVGGILAYENRVKVEELGVSSEDLEREGAVSETVARQMAAGVAGRFDVAVGIGVTGVAGPGGGSEEKPVGTVWISTSVEGMVEATHHRFSGNRSAVRERAAQAALAATYRRLAGDGRGA